MTQNNIFSKSTNDKAELFALTPLDLVFVYLIRDGLKMHEAYWTAYRPTDSTIANSEERMTKLAENLYNSKRIQKYMQSQESIETGSDAAILTKEEVAKELTAIAKRLPATSKERADALMKLADLQGMKKSEVKEEEQVVHYYLPITCERCPLYVNKLRSGQKD